VACHKSVGGAEGVCPLGRRAQAREGEAGSLDGIEATVGRGKAKLFPLRVIAGAKPVCFRNTQPDLYFCFYHQIEMLSRSYAAAEKSEPRIALKIRLGARLFQKILPLFHLDLIRIMCYL